MARDAHPADGRQVLIAVSAAGKHLVQAHRCASQQWLMDRLAGLEHAQRETLTKAADLLSVLVDENS